MTGEDVTEGALSWLVRRAPLLWGAAFSITMFGMIPVVMSIDAPNMVKTLMMVAPMLLLIPLVRSTERAQAACGNFSPALRRYNRRALVWMFAYVAALFLAIYAYRAGQPAGLLAWGLAILPALPLFGFIWAMGAYLAEEQDEYLRQRVILAALWATGILLAVATGYGFLEMFRLVPHVDSWAAVPVWAMGLGIGNIIVRKMS